MNSQSHRLSFIALSLLLSACTVGPDYQTPALNTPESFKEVAGWKVAVTCLAWSMVTWQGAVPEQAPDQPVKAEPWAAEAVRVTSSPSLNWDSQVVPQSIPDGLELTVPWPVPCLLTVRR